LIALDAVLELLAVDPNEGVVRRADEFLAGLGDPRDCRNPGMLARAAPLPANAEARARLRALTEALEAARNLERRGAHAEALSALDRLSELARREAYAPLLAEILALRGAVEATAGRADAAEATLREAASVAASATDDRLLAQVWLRLLELLAERGRLDEALTLAAVASAAVARVDDDQALKARLHNALGGIHLARGDYDAAHDAYERALLLQRAIGADGNRALAPAIANLALANWYKGDFGAALAGQREALELMIRDLGADHSSVGYAHQNIGDLVQQMGEGRRTEAERHYREALRIWTASLGADHPNLALSREQLAILASQRGDLEQAQDHVGEALRLREAAYGDRHPLVLQALIVAIEIESAMGTPAAMKRANELVARATALRKELGPNADRYESFLARARAKYAEARGDHRQAISAYRDVVDARRAELGADHRHTADALVELAMAATSFGPSGLADASLREARRSYQRAHAVATDPDTVQALARELTRIDDLLGD
jgi:eukaryotic-like serine/threonine-protein kinase